MNTIIRHKMYRPCFDMHSQYWKFIIHVTYTVDLAVYIGMSIKYKDIINY